MNCVLENTYLKVEVSPQGAELQNIFHKQFQLEYLWQGDPAVWPRKAPVLFPIVGKLKDNTYRIAGKEYMLFQHGFARDNTFTLISSTGTSVVYRLTHNEDSLKNFPFEFQLDITYSIKDSALEVTYNVQNLSLNTELYYSIGAHPGFRCPLTAGETFEDYYLEFEKEEKLKRILLDGGLRSDQTETVPLTDSNTLPLSFDLFGPKDAIVVSGLNSERISLRSKKSVHGLHFDFKSYPWFGIWSKPGPFICLEPWMGVADHIDAAGDYTEKESIQFLKPGAEASFSYSIGLF